MKKYLCAAVAILMIAVCFTACGKKNVSDDPNGKITAPTVTTMPTLIPEPTVTTIPTEMTTAPTTRPTESNNGSVSPSTGEPGGMDILPENSSTPATDDTGMGSAKGRRIRPMP